MEWFDMTPNVDDNTIFKTMSKYESKYSLYDYFANKYASTNHITAERQTIYPIQTIRLRVMASFKRKLCLRKQNSETNQRTFIRRSRQPTVFLWSCSVLGSVQIGSSFPQIWTQSMFKSNLNKWSKDLHCMVQFLKKSTNKRWGETCSLVYWNPFWT